MQEVDRVEAFLSRHQPLKSRSVKTSDSSRVDAFLSKHRPTPRTTVQPTPAPQKRNIFEKGADLISSRPTARKVFDTIKGFDLSNLGKAFTSGAKTLPGQFTQAAGLITGTIAKNQRDINEFFGSRSADVLSVLAPQYQGVQKLSKISKAIKLPEKIDEAGRKIREVGFEKQQKAQEEIEKDFQFSTGAQGILEQVAFNAPQVLATTGLGMGTMLLTKNPNLAQALTLSTGYGLGASEVYNSAKEFGLPEEQALPISMVGGTIIGGLEAMPIDRLIGKVGVGKKIKKTLIKNVIDGLLSVSTQAGYEGITEGLQEIVGNAIRKTYDENQGLFEGVPEATIVGAILGGMSDVTIGAATSVLGNKSTPQQISDAIEQKVEEAISKPAEKRTSQETQIVEALTTQEMTPDQAANYVFENKLTGTKEGNTIMKAVIQAKREGSNIGLVPKGDSVEIQLGEEGFTKQVTPSAEEVSVTPDQVTTEKKAITASPDLLISHEGAPDTKAVEQWKQKIEAGEDIPPLKVIREGEQYGIEDGKHRFEAYKQLGIKDIPIEIVQTRQVAKKGDAVKVEKKTKINQEEIDSFKREASNQKDADEFSNDLFRSGREEQSKAILKEVFPDENYFNALDLAIKGRYPKEKIDYTKGVEVFHGSEAKFDKIDPSKSDQSSGTGVGKGHVFYTTDREVARSYGENIITETIKPNNPLVVDAKSLAWDEIKFENKKYNINELAKLAENRGHDSLVVENVRDTGGKQEEGIPAGFKQATTIAMFTEKKPVKKAKPKKKTKKQGVKEAQTGEETILDRDPQKKFDKEGKEKKPPVKKGKGAIFDRVFDEMKLETNVEDNFDSITLRDQAKRGTDYVESNPEDAIRVSLRQMPPPDGVRFEAVNIAASKQALANGDHKLYTDLVAARSIIQSRSAQGLGIERLVNSMSTDHFVKIAYRDRLLKLAEDSKFKARFKRKGKATIGLDIVSESATSAKQKVDNTVKSKIANAQSIIDSLTC